jgi:hypothetical protein
LLSIACSTQLLPQAFTETYCACSSTQRSALHAVRLRSCRAAAMQGYWFFEVAPVRLSIQRHSLVECWACAVLLLVRCFNCGIPQPAGSPRCTCACWYVIVLEQAALFYCVLTHGSAFLQQPLLFCFLCNDSLCCLCNVPHMCCCLPDLWPCCPVGRHCRAVLTAPHTVVSDIWCPASKLMHITQSSAWQPTHLHLTDCSST